MEIVDEVKNLIKNIQVVKDAFEYYGIELLNIAYADLEEDQDENSDPFPDIPIIIEISIRRVTEGLQTLFFHINLYNDEGSYIGEITQSFEADRIKPFVTKMIWADSRYLPHGIKSAKLYVSENELD